MDENKPKIPRKGSWARGVYDLIVEYVQDKGLSRHLVRSPDNNRGMKRAEFMASYREKLENSLHRQQTKHPSTAYIYEDYDPSDFDEKAWAKWVLRESNATR